MSIDEKERQKYFELRKEVCSMVLTPKGEFRTIEYQSHEWNIEKLLNEEYGIDSRDEFWNDKYKLKTHDTSFESWASSKYGYIITHTSGNVVLWLQIPRKKVDEAMFSVLKTQYALGEQVDLIIKALEYFNEKFDEYNDYFGDIYEKKW